MSTSGNNSSSSNNNDGEKMKNDIENPSHTRKYKKKVEIKKSRPKRSSSQHVDYNLKHAKIIQSEESDMKHRKKNKLKILLKNPQDSTSNTTVVDVNLDAANTTTVKKPLFERNEKGEIISMNDDFLDTNYGSDQDQSNPSIGRDGKATSPLNNYASESISSKSKTYGLDSRNSSGDNTVNQGGQQIHDIINGATGLPLSHFPTEKIKKERLWNYKKLNSSSSTHNLKQKRNNNNNNNNITLIASPISVFEPVKRGKDQDKYDRVHPLSYVDTPNNPAFSSSKSISPFNSASTSISSDNISSSSPQTILSGNELAQHNVQMYTSQLKTHESDHLTHQSNLRHVIPNEKDDTNKQNKDQKNDLLVSHAHTPHKIISKPLASKNKLFITTTNDIEKDTKSNNSQEASSAQEREEYDFENEDFCSTCGQTGSFLCCDTCPKSFHFLCLDPPIDPNNIPEGDWSCPNCVFKSKYPNQSQYRKGERAFMKELDNNKDTKDHRLFGKLLFKLQSLNPKQYSLPQSMKDTFEEVRTGPYNQYNDDTFKTPLTERQLFNTSYGQSITKLDTYSPEIHYAGNDNDVDDDSNNEKFLICYKCQTTRFGTWDHPEDARLLIKCDYCQTPWHLDCIPNIPRASLKNLGYKWKCPLHANTKKQRRLTKKQPFIKPLQSCGYKNNGDIEIILDEISAGYNNKRARIGDLDPIPRMSESSIKVDFYNKILDYKRLERINNLKLQEQLIDKIVTNQSNNTNLHDISSLIYFNYCNTNKNNEKIWNMRELCQVTADEIVRTKKRKAGSEIKIESQEKNKNTIKNTENIMLTSDEINELLLVKKLIQSKPKEEIIKFFNLE